MSTMKKDITIKDIAREAGVSISTVSNFFNKRNIVSEKLIKRIEKVISKYNYGINIAASSLRGKNSKLIGIIIPDSSNLAFSYVIKIIEKLARDKGYGVVVCNSDYNQIIEIEYINALKLRNVDGLIMIPTIEDRKIFN